MCTMKPKPKKARVAPGGYVPGSEEEVAKQLRSFASLDEFADSKPALADEMVEKAIQFSCQSPTVMLHVLEALISALAKGITEVNGEEIELGSERFPSRLELKVWCSKILKLYNDGDALNPKDAQKMLEVLSFHPRGAAKAQGCVAMRTGLHPSGKMRCFYVVRQDGSEEDFSYIRCVDNAPTFEVRSQERICRALSTILEVNPTTRKTFSEMVATRFPLTKGNFRKVSRHRNWVGSLLMLCSRNMSFFMEYLPIVVVRHLVQVDSEPCVEEKDRPAGQDNIADVLDCTMMVFFEFLQRHLTPAATTAAGDKIQQDLVYSMLFIFNTVILHTHKVKCVQFLWFYIASLRPSWSEAFLRLLIEVAARQTEALEKRLLAYSYVASFLARAQFLNVKFAVKTFEFLAVIGRELLLSLETGLSSAEEFQLLVASVQSACYILVWWAEGFAQEMDEDGVNCLDKVLPEYGQAMTPVAFTPLLLSSHRPIAYIARPVAKEFCRTIRSRPKLAELLATQLREAPPSRDETHEMTLKGDGFFPYDPYRLPHSNIFLSSIYRVWSREEAEISKPRSGSSESLDTEMEVDQDDFTDDADAQSRGFTPLVGPSPAFRPGEMMDMEMAVSPVFGATHLLPPPDDDFEALPAAAIDSDNQLGSSFLSQRLSSEAYRLQVA